MDFKYDPEAQALYIRISPNPIHVTRSISPDIIADVDRDDQIVGLEFLNIQERI